MADATLVTQRRTAAGKGPAGRARREGLVPAVVYGLGAENVPVSVPARELGHFLAGAAGANTVFTLKLDGADQLALARQIQRHPVKGTLLHVDFVRVRADQTIEADVPVHLTGDAEGAARGGVLEQFLYTVSVEARPADVPNSLEIDITALEIGDAVYVRDLTVPSGVVITNDADETLAQVSAPRVVEEEVPAAAEGEEVAEGAEGAPAAAEGGGGGGGGEGESAGGE
jgi:large subunit ribosomal protein L25